MGRLFAFILLLLAVVGGTFAYFVYTARDHVTVAVLPTGTGAGEVAARAGGGEEPAICPLGIEALDDERLVLADLGNNKLIQIDAPTNTYRENSIELDPAQMVEGVLYDAGNLFIWTLDADTSFGAVTPLRLASDGRYTIEQGGGFLGEVVEPSPDAFERLADLGFMPPDDGSGFLASAARQRSASRIVLEEWNEGVDVQEGRVAVDFNLTDQGEIEYHIHTLDGRSLVGLYVLEGGFVSAHLYRRLVDGKAPIILSESRVSEGVLSFAQTVIMVNLADGKTEIYRVPAIANEICQPKQNLTISKSGAVYALSVAADAARINRLVASNPLLAARFVLSGGYQQFTQAPARAPSENPLASLPLDEPVAAVAPEAPAESTTAAFSEVRRGETIERRQVLRNACLYLRHPWVLASANYNLVGRSERWRRPNRLEGKDGMPMNGLPYAWGAADRLSEFDQKISMGRPAGDVCTPSCGGNIVRDEEGKVNAVFTAGVDCSGFVLRAWGWRGARHTTSSLSEIAAPVTLEELQPGDILNLPGSHVRMFLGWRGPSIIEFAESSVSCGGVCRRSLPIVNFSGYAPLRPRHVGSAGTVISLEEIDALCPVRPQAVVGPIGDGG